jgi:hypothetical protein
MLFEKVTGLIVANWLPGRCFMLNRPPRIERMNDASSVKLRV